MEHSIHCHISSSVHPCWFLCWTIRCRRGYHQRTSYARNGSSPPGCGRERRDNDPLHYRHCGVDVPPLRRYRSTCKTLPPTNTSIVDGSCLALSATFFGALVLSLSLSLTHTHTHSLSNTHTLPPLSFVAFFISFSSPPSAHPSARLTNHRLASFSLLWASCALALVSFS